MRWVLIVVLGMAGCWAAGAEAQQKGGIGVAVETVTPALMAEKNLEFPGGVYVRGVTEGGPAAQAGIEAGEVIFSVNGQAVHSAEELKVAIEALQPGSKAQLWVGRGSQVFASEVQVAAPTLVPVLMLDTGGHMAKIWKVAFTPDGRQLVSASDDKTIRVWDVATGKTVRTIRGEVATGHAGKIFAMALSQDGKWLAVGGWLANYTGTNRQDVGAIRLYDFASGRLVSLLKGHEDVVYGLAFSPDGLHLISGSFDKTAIIWDVGAGKAEHRLQGHTAEIYTVGFTPDGKRAVTGSLDHELRLWSVETGVLLQPMTGHRDKVYSLAVAPDGRIASGDLSGEIRLWDGRTGAFLKRLDRQKTAVGSLSFSPDGEALLSGVAAQEVGPFDCHVYDLASGREIVSYRGHDNVVIATAISPDGRWAATGGGNDRAIQIWDLRTGTRRQGPDGQPLILGGTGHAVWAVGFQVNGHQIAWGNTNSNPGGITPINDRGPLQHALTLPSANETLSSPQTLGPEVAGTFRRAMVRHGSWSLSQRKGGSYGYDAILDINEDSMLRASIERGPADGNRHIAYSFTPDGETIVSGGSWGVITAYDRAGRRLGDFIGHDGDVWAVAPSLDEHYLVSSSDDQTVRLWNLKTRELLVTIFRGTDGRWIAWTPEGYYAGSPGADNIVGWQINKGANKAADYVTAEQLRDYLYRPDIVDRAIILGSAQQALREAKRTDHRLEDLLAIERPRFALAAPERATGGAATLTLTLEATADPVKEIAIGVNGTNVPFDKKSVIESAGKGPQTVQVPLFHGKNVIRVSAKNNGGETSKTLEILHEGEGALDHRGTLYVLAIGVSAYPNLGAICGDDRKATCDLPDAGQNAEDFAEFAVRRLQSSHRNPPVKRVMVNGAGVDLEPTAANITGQLKLLSQAKANDTVVLFISGHGDNEAKTGLYRFFASDTRFGSGGQDFEPGSFVPWPEIDGALNGAYGRKLLFVDTCFSSGAYYKGFGGRAFYANEVAYLSAGPNQKGLWHEEYGGSLFARATVDGFNGGAKAPVTTSGLADYMKSHLQELLDDLKHAKRLPPEVRQDMQYVLGRDANDFVLTPRE